MRDRLKRDLTAALKSRDRVAVAALRSALAAIDNAEAVEVGSRPTAPHTSARIAGATAGAGSSDVDRRLLSGAEMNAIVRAEIDQRAEAAEEYERLGRPVEADTLRRESAVLSAYVKGQ